MFQKLSRTAVALALGGMLMTTGVMAQNATMFGDKLGVMPRTPANSATINGTGTVTATLTGSSLAISGTYQGLSTPATTVAVHNQKMGDMGGPEIATISASGGTSGTFSGTLNLSAEQLQMLQSNALSVIVKSEGNQVGELRAWLVAHSM